MRLAIVHYHLRPGGVTRVIHSAVEALAGRGVRIAVLAGDLEQLAPGPAAHRRIPSLDYRVGSPSSPPDVLRDELERAAGEALGGPPDVWHIHNHSLGRHPAFTAAVAQLAERRARLLLQIHDFAEDGRPANYRDLREQLGPQLGRALYPAAPHAHYAVLNRRDQRILAAAGLPDERLHLLPNPVLPTSGDAAGDPALPPLVLYPTRALRRKNIGEFLLWAACERGDRRFALTLAPLSPADRIPYEAWKTLATRLKLPVLFELGLQPGIRYGDLLARATALATTSVAEGFGLAFTEPWLAGRPVVGRNLPEITADMTESGLDLGELYTRLEVPLAWVGAEALAERVRCGVAETYAAYGCAPPADADARAQAAMVNGAMVDFGRLDEALQARVIERVAAGEAGRDLAVPSAAGVPAAQALVERNRRCVREAYGIERYAGRLMDAYAALLDADTAAPGAGDAARVLDAFLDPARLHLLRS